MKFIKKKNFQEGEELLYTPSLHWMFTVRHMVLSLPFFLLLLILWVKADSLGGSFLGLLGLVSAILVKLMIRNVFLATLIVILLVFVWRIFLYLSTEYGVTNKRLIMKKGVFRTIVTEIPIDRIESIYCTQGILGRLFHYGTIRISGVGGLMPLFFRFGGMMPVFSMVNRPYALRRKIVEIVEKNKTITVVHGDLPKVTPVAEPEPIIEDEPIYRYGTFVRVITQ